MLLSYDEYQEILGRWVVFEELYDIRREQERCVTELVKCTMSRSAYCSLIARSRSYEIYQFIAYILKEEKKP